ncbi:hypothetical protein D3C73_1646670 [compost metagenome]
MNPAVQGQMDRQHRGHYPGEIKDSFRTKVEHISPEQQGDGQTREHQRNGHLDHVADMPFRRYRLP